jgi:hypothetical protein
MKFKNGNDISRVALAFVLRFDVDIVVGVEKS